MTGVMLARVPIVPLRDVVVFPEMKVPFVVGRTSSVAAVTAAVAAHGDVLLVMQRDADVKEPRAADLHAVGTLARLVHHQRLPDGNLKVLVEGRIRCRVENVEQVDGYLAGLAPRLEEPAGNAASTTAASARLKTAWEAHCRTQGLSSAEPVAALLAESELARATDELAARLHVAAAEKQALLETLDPLARATRLEALLQLEESRQQIEQGLQKQVQKQVEQSQKEYLLHEKMKAIQKELGRKAEIADTDKLLERIEGAGMPAEAKERAIQEVRRLESMPAASAEANVVRSYVDWLVGMPWKKRSKERRDFEHARRVLEADHFGLEKVKERILEFLAVRSLKRGPARGSILCLVGPPGVGKTSLGRSIAKATGREYVRLSLGGVRDEAEIRGHRRTYIGAYPGRIVQMLHRCGSKNPVFVLDEIDKLASDFRGDPASALLEVLDPEQNNSFLDHYLDVGFDLSEVMFICTANVAEGIPVALRDRLEVIRIAGYTQAEKLAIAERFLVAKQRTEHGLRDEQLQISREALEALIDGYTREAGVRSLEREIGSVARKAATKIVRDKKARLDVRTAADLEALLGVPKFRRADTERTAEVGLATGLAWTELGGQVLTVEAVRMKGTGKVQVTGQLGDVMQESARAALSYLRSRSESLGLPLNALEGHDLHVHVPEGAIPKDGPSAGITMATALASALSGRRVRNDIAMTGEITLRGRVLPVGGIKEKMLAAHRVGIREVILPAENQRDLAELTADVRDAMKFTFASTMDDVLPVALLPPDPGGDAPVPSHLLTADGPGDGARA